MNKNLKIFNPGSRFYDLRWFIVIVAFLTLFMVWHDLRGGRMFTSSKQQQWNSNGPGYHK